ncbi:carboxymuconolactone decarboxylase family protein [Corallococcus exercitus]|uniref:carboxymuconolactone decarboxylase family protein n=1 Tax=Corallococcus exercitus TaxID=2316736 RepID=UPI0035D5283F
MEQGQFVQPPTSTVPQEPPPGTQSQEVSGLLSCDALRRLRSRYNDKPSDPVAEISQKIIWGMYSQSDDLLKEMMSEFYSPQKFARSQDFAQFARDREQIVIALLAARVGNRRMYLAVHFYWGLMVGLSPAEIAHRLLFVSFYSGIDTLTSSLETLSAVLNTLQDLANKAKTDDALEPRIIMGELKALFP